MILSGDDSHNFQFALDKNPVSASFEVQGPDETSGQQYPIKGTASFTYVSSGKLRTVTLTATLNSSGESATYDFTAEVVESGDDTYYLPIAVAYLQPGAKKAEIDEAFGGEGKFKEALKAGTDKKKVYIYSSVIGIIPVSVYSIMGSTGYISFMYRDIEGTTKIQHIIASTVNIIYPEGYKLSPSLYSLTSSSSSDDISTAVGGESGLKEIIQAVKDGNRLVIRGTPPDDLDIGQFSTDVLMSQYKESENGDIQIIYTLFGWAQGGGYLGGSMYALVYTKSSNTFDLSKVNFQLSS